MLISSWGLLARNSGQAQKIRDRIEGKTPKASTAPPDVQVKPSPPVADGYLNYSALEDFRWGFPKIGRPHYKDYSLLGSILGSPYLGKAPRSAFVDFVGAIEAMLRAIVSHSLNSLTVIWAMVKIPLKEDHINEP